MNSSESKDAAAGPLGQLAAQLRALGLTVAILDQDRSSFPALLVGSGAVKAVVMAGAAHFWRRAADGDMRFIGPLEEPKKAAHTVHKFLTDDPEQRHPHRFRFREETGTPIGRTREVPVVAGAPAVVVAGAGR